MSLSNRPRVRQTNSDLSTLVGLKIGEWLNSHPSGLNAAYRLFAERTLQFADDNYRRSKGKIRTWSGVDDVLTESQQLSRLKSVEATIGTIVACASRGEPRNTPSWVLDALQYTYGILK